MRPLGDICKLRKETCLPHQGNSEIYVGLEHINSGRFFLSRHGSPAQVRSAKSRFYPGDVLYGKLRPYLDKAVVAETEGICSTDILVLEPIEVPSWFLCGVLHSDAFLDYAKQTTHGVNHPRTSWSGIKEFETTTFALLEQKKIAAVLLKIQRAIEMQEKIIQSLRDLKKSTMQHLFTHGTRGEKTKMTEIGELPESWKVMPFISFAVLQRGFDITRSSQRQGNVPVVSSGGIRSYHDTAKCKGPGVIIGRKGSLGTVHYVEADYWPHDTTLWVKDFKGNSPLYVYWFLQTLRLERFDSGASNPTLNRNTVHKELVAVPMLQEQEDIARFLSLISAKSSSHESKKSILQDLFKTTLNKLMASEIRVSDLDIDVREVEM